MSRTRCLSLVATILFLATSVFATCDAPSTKGVRICYPSQGSTVTYPPTFQFSSNLGGAGIAGVAVYDNGKKVDTFSFLPGKLYEFGIHNGSHNVTLKLWDTEGNVYSAQKSFTVVGYGVGFCSNSSVGVKLCSPDQGGFAPRNGVPVSFKANGYSKITAWKLYIDGKTALTSMSDNPDSLLAAFYMSAGTHRISVNAWDTQGRVYKASKTFTAFYQYDCNPETGACSPGIITNAPRDFGPYGAIDTPTSFRFQADVTRNPNPIAKMVVMLDGKTVMQNQGPGITTQISTTPGSHVIDVRAWDTAGKMYATYGTINAE